MTTESRPWLLHVHYCGADFYTGYWLYSDPVKDGAVRYSKGQESIWFDGSSFERSSGVPGILMEIVTRHGHPELPRPTRYSDEFAEAFAAAFPLGILGHGPSAHPYYWVHTEVNTDASLLVGWPYGQQEAAEANDAT